MSQKFILMTYFHPCRNWASVPDNRQIFHCDCTVWTLTDCSYNEAKRSKITSSSFIIQNLYHHRSDCTNTQRHKWATTSKNHHKTNVSTPSAERWLEISQQPCPPWMNLLATFPPPVPSAHSCIVCLHQAAPQSHSGGWSSASFTDIRVCLCGWVMDLLCWYVLLWWLQRAVQWLGSFHWTVTQRLLCFGKTCRRWLFTQQTPRSPDSPPPTVNLPIPQGHLASQQSQTKRPGSKQSGFYWWIWNMYFSLLFIGCIFFWNASENPHFPFPSGAARPGEREGDTGHVVVVRAKFRFSLMCFKTDRSEWQCPVCFLPRVFP